MSDNPKILVLGHARHGKDTVAEMMASIYDLKFTSSSLFCAERVIWPIIKGGSERLTFLDRFSLGERVIWAREIAVMYEYADVTECFDDRGNHRELWYQAIGAFNRPDASSLGRAIFADHDIYCGLRSARELCALQNTEAFDMSVWVDASERHPPEDRSSCTVEPWMASRGIDNNGTLEELEFNVRQLMDNALADWED